MEETTHYDVFVIGTGIAGQTAAEICVNNKMTVAIADNRAFGGTCALRGCDPKKILLQFTDLVHKSQLLMKHGISKPPKIKWKDVQKFKSSFTDSVPLSTEKKLADLGIDYYHQSPVFQNENQVLIEGKLISADTFVIATGMIPRELKFEGSEYLEISDDILNLKKLPKKVTFIGSGYVGMEFACMLATMGCKVTMIEQGVKPLSQFDDFLVQKLVAHLETIGITFIFNAEVVSIEKLKKNVKVHYKLQGKDQLLKSRKVYNTAGRVPSIEMLNLPKADIKSDKSGVLVNDFLQSTSNPNIFACGDVSSKSLPLTPLSGLQGYIVGNNIVKANSKKFDVPCVPSTVFTNPKLSTVGYSEEEAQKRFKNVKIYKGDGSGWYNAKKENNPVYAYKILVNERTNVIVGAHLLSSQANETINIFSMAIQQKMTVLEFKKQMFTYPSYSSDLKSMLKEEE
ncbi:glutathione reductase (NADPH) [Mariniflexile fucanivorans]|uniref:Glutathione reductase (NADPH) n=1 Tax=Mariniflexile fucanivorans TaxID=264023 RepID=A0A4R1RCB1_9FLAO|nr:NAD(P)/FAD-dependent oxidoreductase [Mariniflexile fucanivorans]TCL63448.1 glutathione reductase (NADPH) [Mariniflexile fucanivorans]